MTIPDIIQLIRLVQDRRTTYGELIAFLSGEAPPRDHNFLKRIDIADVATVMRSPAYTRRSLGNIEFSVIVPTFNGAGRLRNAVAALLDQTGVKGEYEMIIVDDGSTERSGAVIDEYFREYPDQFITYVYYPENRGPAFARNVGITLAIGVFVCFTDDDCEVPADWLMNFRLAFRGNPEIAGVGGWYKPVLERGYRKITLFSRFTFWESLPYTLWAVKSSSFAHNYAGNTANSCYRKSILMKVGGFNHYFTYASSEDWELKIRLIKARFLLLYQPRFVIHRKGHLGLAAFIRLYLVRGWSGFLLYKIHPDYTSYHRTLARSLGQCFIQIAELFSWRYRMPVAKELEFSYLFIPLNFLKYLLLCIGKYGLLIWDKPRARHEGPRMR